MNLDDLKAALHTLEDRLDASLDLAARERTARALDRTRTALRPLAVGLWVEVAVAAVIALWLGAFLYEHVGTLTVSIPAGVLHVANGLVLAVCVRQLVMIHRIDYTAPVLQVQRELAELRAFRIRSTQAVLLGGIALWTLPLVVGVKTVLGLDFIAVFGLTWLMANVAFGLALIPLVLWVSKAYADRLAEATLVRRLADDLAGRSLTQALRFVDEVTAYEHE